MYRVELTDTFAGEANYSWVKRAKIDSPPTELKRQTFQRLLMRKAKAAVGMTGNRGVTYSHGDHYEFRPYGMCVVMFVTWEE